MDNEQMTTNLGMEEDYLNTIQEMKKNTVSREAYDKMRDENKRLLETIVSGRQIENPEPQPQRRSVEEIRNELFGGRDHSNLRYAELSLELRDAVLAEGGIDTFVPRGKKIKATPEDYESAERVAAGLRHCIEYAQGDSEIFTNELQRITDDVVIRRNYR